jgi:hypothetical protein
MRTTSLAWSKLMPSNAEPMRRLLLTALAVVMFAGSARAEYHLLGPGGSSCGSWTAHGRTRDWFQLSWVLGFLSGIGYADAPRHDPLRGVDAEGVAGWLDNYCQAHPLQKLVDAAKAFVDEHPH